MNEDIRVDFLVGNILLLLAILFFVGGCIAALPFWPPLEGTFVYFTLLLYVFFEVWRNPHSPLSGKFPGWLWEVPMNEVELFVLSICVLLTIPYFRYLNGFWLEKRVPLERDVWMKTSVGAQVEQELDVGSDASSAMMVPLARSWSSRTSMFVKKRNALARELGMVVEHLSFIASAHPVLLCLFHLRAVRKLRWDVHRLLSVARSWAVLDFAIVNVNAPRLLAFAGADSISLLREATPNLSKEAKAVLLHALQQSPHMFRRRFSLQLWAAEIFLCTTGKKLSMLKDVLDFSGDSNNLVKFVFRDVCSVEVRTRILDHFKAEAEMWADDKTSKSQKVASSINDTLYCSGGIFPAGVDKTFPRHAFYPGILQLLMEIDLQHKEGTHPHGGRFHADSCVDQGIRLEIQPSNIVFLSSKPHLYKYKEFTEPVSTRLFKSLVAEGRLPALPSLLPGTFWLAVRAVFRASLRRPDPWHGLGRQKVAQLEALQRLHPSCSFLFFGDNGRADVVTAELALSARPRLARVAIIREVQPRALSATTLNDLPLGGPREARWAELGVIFVSTAIDAAVCLVQRGLLSSDSLQRVKEFAVGDLEALAVRHPTFPAWPLRVEELNRALVEAARADRQSGEAYEEGRVFKAELDPHIANLLDAPDGADTFWASLQPVQGTPGMGSMSASTTD